MNDEEGRSQSSRLRSPSASDQMRRVKRALQERERTLDRLLDNLPGMAYRCAYAPGWPMKFVSGGCEELTGYPMETLIADGGLLYGERIPPEDRERIRGEVVEAVDQARAFVLEYRILHADGRERWVWERGRGVRTDDGRVTDLEGFVTDITERCQLEQQLQAAQKMEAVGRLAGGVAHDFNNTLAVILGSAALAKREVSEDSRVEAELSEILAAGRRAADLTRQLLAFSRQQVLELRVLDLNRVVAKLEKLLRRIIGEDIALRTTLASGIGKVRADPGQLEQVLMNLAVNARDAMPRGGRITVETRNVELDAEYAARHVAVTPGAYVLLAVTDSGTGMDDSVRRQVFEPFFTTKGRQDGTGLGLSTVYGIVKQSGGNIWVYSEPGRGTTFKIYLPRVEGQHESEDPPDYGMKRTSRPASVLLVEDDASVRRLMERMLTTAGHTVLCAADAAEAERAIQQHPGTVDLLLTDVVMPNGSGPELAAALQRDRPSLRVLFMSGYAGDAIVHHGILESGAPFISKPFSPSELLQKIQETLRRTSEPLPGGD